MPTRRYRRAIPEVIDHLHPQLGQRVESNAPIRFWYDETVIGELVELRLKGSHRPRGRRPELLERHVASGTQGQ
jgi:hypothetical protein